MADSSSGLRIGLEGEREFKRAITDITDINREMRGTWADSLMVNSAQLAPPQIH